MFGFGRFNAARRPYAALAAVLAAGLILRLWGIRWGFPLLVNGDEPHFVDIAVSFGGGSLNPHYFKYPTLWMYVLSVAYGFYYATWSLLGPHRTVAQFGALFVWQTWRFHLIGRLLSALFSCAGFYVVGRMDEECRAESTGSAWPWAMALLAVSPGLVNSAHEAKADSLMFLFSASAWMFSLRLLRDGRAKDSAAAGLSAGLAFSSQYTALPARMLPFLALALRAATKRETPERTARLALTAGGLSALGFLVGCPYSILDFPAFRAAMGDHVAYKTTSTAAARGADRAAWTNLLLIAGRWSLTSIAIPFGVCRLWPKDRTRLALLPILVWSAFLSRQHDGGNLRYLYAVFPALALLAAEGLSSALAGRKALVAAVVAAGALLPGAWLSARADRIKTLADTRLAATAWIETNIPQGATIVLDQPDASPDARVTRDQAEELRAMNAASGSARARYYALMRDSHPGGGWRVYRLKRSAADVDSNPDHVRKAQSEGAFVDASAGLSSLRALGVSYVVTSTFGARPDRSPDLARFFEELSREGRPLARFEPDEKTVVGPTLQIYRILP